MSEPAVVFREISCADGKKIAHATLNAEKSLNSLSLEMVDLLAAEADQWERDDSIVCILLDGAGDKALAAGGDIRMLYESMVESGAGYNRYATEFFSREYRFNYRMHNFPKPIIVWGNGIVMGGGVGVSLHGSHRVAGDRFTFAMPEVGIGFFPDVGATWFLPRLPGELGAYCGLTGERFGIADAVAAGIATHRVPSARFGALIDGLTGTVSVNAVLAAFAEPAGEGPILARRATIDRLFAGSGVEDILDALDREAASGSTDAEWAARTAATMRTKSPLSLKIALAQVRRGKDWDFKTCMLAEFRIVSRVIKAHDFYEGVRAVIIDKDNAPRWQPATLREVNDAEVERHFAPLGAGELALP